MFKCVKDIPHDVKSHNPSIAESVVKETDKKAKFELHPSQKERDTSDQLIVRNSDEKELLNNNVSIRTSPYQVEYMSVMLQTEMAVIPNKQ